jgi:hypothetical protein
MQQMNTRRLVLILFLIFQTPGSLAATEKLGRVELTDVLVKPTFLLKEPQEGEFDLNESSIEFAWYLENQLQANIRLGSRSLLNSMARYSEPNPDELGLIEAFAQYSSVYGQVRAGLIPLQYGAEGAMNEREIYFQRSLLLERRVLPLRDVGLEYSVQHNGYYSDLKVHNGESQDNVDGRMWVSGNWGWKDREKFKVGLAGLSGTTKPIATATSSDTLANVDETLPAKWRMGTFFLQWYPSEWKTVLEWTMGEVEQLDDVQGKFSGGHADLFYETKRWAAMIRWDYFEPNSQVKNDIERRASIGWIFKNQSQTAQLKLIGTKIEEDGAKVANDELWLIWQLSPLVTHHR